jgi:hypothetical protein
MNGGTRPEHAEDVESGNDVQPQGTHVTDLPTKARREAEDEMLETPAAP